MRTALVQRHRSGIPSGSYRKLKLPGMMPAEMPFGRCSSRFLTSGNGTRKSSKHVRRLRPSGFVRRCSRKQRMLCSERTMSYNKLFTSDRAWNVKLCSSRHRFLLWWRRTRLLTHQWPLFKPKQIGRVSCRRPLR